MKKTKTQELNQANNKHSLLAQQHDDLESEYDKISHDLIEAKNMIKKNEEYYDIVSKNYENKYQEEKEIEAKTLALSKEN